MTNVIMLINRISITNKFVFKVIMLGSFTIYILLYCLGGLSALTKKFVPTPYPVEDDESIGNWMWECQGDMCVRMPAGQTSEKFSSTFSSIGECRLVCLRFSTVWPKPTGVFKISRETQNVDLNTFTFNTHGVKGNDSNKAYLKRNSIDIFTKNLRTFCPHKTGLSSIIPNRIKRDVLHDIRSSPMSISSYVNISFITTSDDMKLDWNTDEKYQLLINSTKSGIDIVINATTVFGARHALQTLSQLFACRKDFGENILVIMSDAKITDKPVYSHRGLLLDTSRTFLPVKTILRTLDGMSSSKLNVFHWHITDSHSFPFYSKRVPYLTKYGAYTSKQIYRPEDIKAIRDYAFLRGIRIIVEIDAPAHAGYGWQWGEKHGKGSLAVCVGKEPWRDYCIQPPCGQLNPVNPHLYPILQDLYADIQDEFPRDMFHMGGDEVFLPCWLSEPNITDWMKAHGMNKTTDADLIKLWSDFQSKALNAWDTAAKSTDTPIILWSSHLTAPGTIQLFLSPDRYVVEMWTEKSDPAPEELLSKGYKLIIATKDAWYLDHGFWGSTTYHKWNDVYDNKILEASLGVYGGEACMWGEYVSDTNIDIKVWPRAACVGERLWSDPAASAQQALPRLLEYTSRLQNLGILPDMIQPEWCRQNDGKCF